MKSMTHHPHVLLVQREGTASEAYALTPLTEGDHTCVCIEGDGYRYIFARGKAEKVKARHILKRHHREMAAQNAELIDMLRRLAKGALADPAVEGIVLIDAYDMARAKTLIEKIDGGGI